MLHCVLNRRVISGIRFHLNDSLLCVTTNTDDWEQISCNSSQPDDTALSMISEFLDNSESRVITSDQRKLIFHQIKIFRGFLTRCIAARE